MLRFGIIGTSWITDSYIEGALDSGLWELTAVYSRTEEKGRAFGAKYGDIYYKYNMTVIIHNQIYYVITFNFPQSNLTKDADGNLKP